MKKLILVAGFALTAFLALAGPASAQTDGLIFCPGVGYRAACPDDIVRPIDDGTDPGGTLPRTGSDSSLPMAKTALVLLGVGGALTVMANRKRLHHARS